MKYRIIKYVLRAVTRKGMSCHHHPNYRIADRDPVLCCTAYLFYHHRKCQICGGQPFYYKQSHWDALILKLIKERIAAGGGGGTSTASTGTGGAATAGSGGTTTTTTTAAAAKK